eukprot:1179833-Prorocentrum_minimum.AAC.5
MEVASARLSASSASRRAGTTERVDHAGIRSAGMKTHAGFRVLGLWDERLRGSQCLSEVAETWVRARAILSAESTRMIQFSDSIDHLRLQAGGLGWRPASGASSRWQELGSDRLWFAGGACCGRGRRAHALMRRAGVRSRPTAPEPRRLRSASSSPCHHSREPEECLQLKSEAQILRPTFMGSERVRDWLIISTTLQWDTPSPRLDAPHEFCALPRVSVFVPNLPPDVIWTSGSVR